MLFLQLQLLHTVKPAGETSVDHSRVKLTVKSSITQLKNKTNTFSFRPAIRSRRSRDGSFCIFPEDLLPPSTFTSSWKSRVSVQTGLFLLVMNQFEILKYNFKLWWLLQVSWRLRWLIFTTFCLQFLDWNFYFIVILHLNTAAKHNDKGEHRRL